MIETPLELRTLAADYVSGLVPLEALDATVARLGDVTVADSELGAVWGKLELLLAELSVGHLSDDEFRAEITAMLEASPTMVYRLEPESARAYTDTATRLHRIRLRLAQWIKSAQVSDTQGGTELASPAGHPA